MGWELIFNIWDYDRQPIFRPDDLIRSARKRPQNRKAKKDRSKIKAARKQRNRK